ncbi:beta-1,3-galactosyltransferase 2-like [Gastrophryne carolinensis]
MARVVWMRSEHKDVAKAPGEFYYRTYLHFPTLMNKYYFLANNKEITASNHKLFEWIRNINVGTKLSTPAEGYLNIKHYPYIINEPDKCKDKGPFLVLLITTAAAEVKHRAAIRRTWGNESLRADIAIVRLFMLGVDRIVDSKVILQESEKHHDIIQKDFQDTYENLTIKTIMGMEWISDYCPGAKYVMKTDTDMFVNINRLLDFLQPNLPMKQNYFTGFVIQNNGPHRNKDSKWHVPYSLYPHHFYPTFCSGTGYVFSGDLAPKILRASFKVKYLYLEDVFVGLCLDKEGIQITSAGAFLFHNYRVPWDPCTYNRIITSHYINSTEIVSFWKSVEEHKGTC